MYEDTRVLIKTSTKRHAFRLKGTMGEDMIFDSVSVFQYTSFATAFSSQLTALTPQSRHLGP